MLLPNRITWVLVNILDNERQEIQDLFIVRSEAWIYELAHKIIQMQSDFWSIDYICIILVIVHYMYVINLVQL